MYVCTPVGSESLHPAQYTHLFTYSNLCQFHRFTTAFLLLRFHITSQSPHIHSLTSLPTMIHSTAAGPLSDFKPFSVRTLELAKNGAINTRFLPLFRYPRPTTDQHLATMENFTNPSPRPRQIGDNDDSNSTRSPSSLPSPLSLTNHNDPTPSPLVLGKTTHTELNPFFTMTATGKKKKTAVWKKATGNTASLSL